MNSSLASPKDKPMKDLSQYTTAQCRLHTQECLSKILPRYPTMQMDVVNPGLKKNPVCKPESLWTKDQILLMYASFAQVTNNLLVQCKDFKTCWLAAIFFYHKSMLSSTSEIWLFKEFTILFTTGLNFKIIKFIIDNDFH